MNFDLSHEQQMIYDYGQSLTKTFDQAYWRDHVERKAFPEELTKQIATDGFLGIMVPEQYGGAGLGMTEQVIFMEGLSHAGFPMLELVASSTMSIPLVAEFGTEEQKQKYIPPCCDGSATFCFMITEAGAGSNSMAINTMAKKRGQILPEWPKDLYLSGWPRRFWLGRCPYHSTRRRTQQSSRLHPVFSRHESQRHRSSTD